MTDDLPRRRLLSSLPLAFASLAAAPLLAQLPTPAPKKKEIEVTPAEDLMREHGVLKRILLIYDEAGWRLASKAEVPFDALRDAAGIVQRFIEDYHEKLEEEHLFPRFRRRKKLVDLVDTLQRQHAAGRKVTAAILSAIAARPKSDLDRQALAGLLAKFTRMYAPHEAREDTVLFPAIRQVVTPAEYDDLGERFEHREHQLFGKEGFEGMVVKVGEIEKKFGLYDLDQYTPK